MNNNLAISTYSFHRFGAGPEGPDLPSLESMIDKTAELGIQGLEIIGNHLEKLGQDGNEQLHALKQYMAARGVTPDQYTEYTSDPDARYKVVIDIDVSALQPTVAFPHIPSNGRVAGADQVKVSHAYVGSCTNGRISDLREVARILKGHTVAEGVQMLIVPATQQVWKQAAQEGR